MGFLKDLQRARQNEEWRSTVVPEIKDEDGKPYRIYAKPLTMRELRLIDRYGTKEGTAIARLVKTAQLTWHDSQGRQLFNVNEIKDVEAALDSRVLSRVMEELNLVDLDDEAVLEEAEKNLTATDD